MGFTASPAFAQDPDMGKTIWEETVWRCSRCHGPAGEGAWGPPLAGNQNPVADWIAQVRSPRRSMPTFSPQQISDEQIGHIHAYLTSLTAPTTVVRPDAGLPADAPQGQVLIVEKRCVACHTTTGPINGFIERKEVPTAQAVITQLRTPRNLMPMFSDSQVSDADAALIADFLASQVSAQLPPPALPTSGGDHASTLATILIIVGCGFVAASFILRRFNKAKA
jgi:mono/diheme cytochrome c family protein